MLVLCTVGIQEFQEQAGYEIFNTEEINLIIYQFA